MKLNTNTTLLLVLALFLIFLLFLHANATDIENTAIPNAVETKPIKYGIRITNIFMDDEHPISDYKDIEYCLLSTKTGLYAEAVWENELNCYCITSWVESTVDEAPKFSAGVDPDNPERFAFTGLAAGQYEVINNRVPEGTCVLDPPITVNLESTYGLISWHGEYQVDYISETTEGTAISWLPIDVTIVPTFQLPKLYYSRAQMIYMEIFYPWLPFLCVSIAIVLCVWALKRKKHCVDKAD